MGLYVLSVIQGFPQSLVEESVVQGLDFLLKTKFLSLKWWVMKVASLELAWCFIMVQLNKVDICELRSKVVTEDEGGLI